MKFYDPYYLIDPTKPMPSPSQGRTTGGKFTHRSMLTGAGDNNFPVDSNYWARYARGARNKLDALRGEDFRLSILNGETDFSWRMICEMYEAARDTLTAGRSDKEAIAAAHTWLLEKQIAAAKLDMDAVMNDKTASAIEQSSAIDRWMSLAWETLPEVEL